MSETKFTPAPWWPHKDSADNWGVRTHRDYEDPNDAALAMSEYAPNLVFMIGDSTEKRTSGDTIEANAHLIAAAPDMYEAINEFLPKNIECNNSNVSDGEIVPLNVPYGEIRALFLALKKARGES